MASGDPDAERRSLDELRTLYDLYPATRDVLVEGRHDAQVIRAYLRWTGCSAEVYDVDDRVNVSALEVLRLGHDVGSRGRLVLVAAEVVAWGAESLCVTCIVDADRAYLDGDLPKVPTLLVTDYGSLEVYALCPTSLDKFFSLVVRIDPEVSMTEICDRLIPPLVTIYVVRHVLHTKGTGVKLNENFASVCDFGTRPVLVDIPELLRRSVPAKAAELANLRTDVEDTLGSLPELSRKFVRGHDIAPLLIRMFNLSNDWAHPPTVEGALLGCLEWAELHEEVMFKQLRARVC